jgi:isoleucyl-tRNA synthetase
VHQAPAFGEDDHRVCIANGIVKKGDELPCPVDANGRFTSETPEFTGVNVKDADEDICRRLKALGRLVLKESYMYSNPFCWRSDTLLIHKCMYSLLVRLGRKHRSTSLVQQRTDVLGAILCQGKTLSQPVG